MPSVADDLLDLTDPDVVADPYPAFAARARGAPVAWHEPRGCGWPSRTPP